MKIEQIPSPNYNRPWRPRVVRGIVIHTMECSETPNAAASVARNWFGLTKSKVSAHYCVDDKKVVQCVQDTHVAWHAGKVNEWTIGIELAGKASQTREQWRDPYSSAQLDLCAELVAKLCAQYSIPVTHLDAEGIRLALPGIFGHVDVTAAYGTKGGHCDPGPWFDWQGFLNRVCNARLA
jgi:N-acetyl-anhydromuramyl-L-alanine amidase AmpD